MNNWFKKIFFSLSFLSYLDFCLWPWWTHSTKEIHFALYTGINNPSSIQHQKTSINHILHIRYHKRVDIQDPIGPHFTVAAIKLLKLFTPHASSHHQIKILYQPGVSEVCWLWWVKILHYLPQARTYHFSYRPWIGRTLKGSSTPFYARVLSANYKKVHGTKRGTRNDKKKNCGGELGKANQLSHDTTVQTNSVLCL